MFEQQETALRERVDSREVLYDGKVVHLEKWQVTLPDGRGAVREVILHPGAAAVAAVNSQGEICLVHQFRTPIGRVTTELPAGKLDPGEDPLVCAQRELSEETGLAADHWQELTTLLSCVGFCNEAIRIYLATGLRQADSHPDEGEFLSVDRMPLATAVEKVLSGEIQDAKTCLGILMADRALQQT